jgi:hypothetical protein
MRTRCTLSSRHHMGLRCPFATPASASAHTSPMLGSMARERGQGPTDRWDPWASAPQAQWLQDAPTYPSLRAGLPSHSPIYYL